MYDAFFTAQAIAERNSSGARTGMTAPTGRPARTRKTTRARARA